MYRGQVCMLLLKMCSLQDLCGNGCAVRKTTECYMLIRSLMCNNIPKSVLYYMFLQLVFPSTLCNAAQPSSRRSQRQCEHIIC